MTTVGRAPVPMLDRLALPLLLLALALRVREAVRAPLWFDELYTRAAVERPWPEVMRIVRADVHPPLHFVVTHAWRLFGDSDLAVRSSSLVFAMATLFLGYVLARDLFGRGAALFATLLVALHPWHIYMSQEARSYPMLWLALTAAWLGAWRWSEHGRRGDAALLVIAASVAAWTHYLAIVLLAVQAAWGVARFAREPRRLGQWLLLHAAVGAAFAPILSLAWVQFHRVEGQHWLQPPHLADLTDTARHIMYQSMRVLVPALALALWPFADSRARRPAAFALAIGPLAVLACWTLGACGIRVFQMKYMLFAVAPVLALVATGTLRLPGRATRWAVATLLVAAATRALVLQPPYPEAASFAAVRERLASRVRAGDVMFHGDAHVYLFGRRYYPALRHRLLTMGQELPYYDGRAVIPDSAFADAAELRAASAGGARWWAIAWGRGGLNANALGACADSFADAPAETCGLVRLWSGVRSH